MGEQITWPSLGPNNCNPCPPPLTRKPKPYSDTVKDANGEGPLETTTPVHIQSTVWQGMSRLLYSACKQDAVVCERTWSKYWHGLCTLQLQRSRTDGPPHPPGLFRLAATETSVMAAGWVNHQQAVGNGGRPAPHYPVPGIKWTEGQGTADRPQKKKNSLRWYSKQTNKQTKDVTPLCVT